MRRGDAGIRRVPGIPGSASAGWRRPSGRQESLAVPEMAGGNLPRANNPWQCQLWVARALGMPGIPGSARAERRMPGIPGSANPYRRRTEFRQQARLCEKHGRAFSCYWRRRLMGCFCSSGGRISYGRFQNGLIRSSSSCAEAVELARWYEGMKLMSSR